MSKLLTSSFLPLDIFHISLTSSHSLWQANQWRVIFCMGLEQKKQQWYTGAFFSLPFFPIIFSSFWTWISGSRDALETSWASTEVVIRLVVISAKIFFFTEIFVGPFLGSFSDFSGVSVKRKNIIQCKVAILMNYYSIKNQYSLNLPPNICLVIHCFFNKK